MADETSFTEPNSMTKSVNLMTNPLRYDTLKTKWVHTTIGEKDFTLTNVIKGSLAVRYIFSVVWPIIIVTVRILITNEFFNKIDQNTTRVLISRAGVQKCKNNRQIIRRKYQLYRLDSFKTHLLILQMLFYTMMAIGGGQGASNEQKGYLLSVHQAT